MTPWLAPECKTRITPNLGCEAGDTIWGLADVRPGELCLARPEALVPGIRARHLGCRALRTPIAYPVFLNDYEEERQRLAAGPRVTGLCGVGHNGELDHILMEDVSERTLRRIPESVRLVRTASPLARVETPPARSLAPPATRFAAAL